MYWNSKELQIKEAIIEKGVKRNNIKFLSRASRQSWKVFGLEQWKAQLITFVSDTCGAVNTRAFNKNLKELKVLGHMHDTIRKGLVHELLIAQDKVLCSYYAQRDGQQNQLKRQGATVRHLRTY